MTLNQALALGNARRTGGGPASLHYLVCGFEPLHLATFLRAHLLERLSGDVELQFGLYGDFLGNLESASQSRAIAAAVVLEWSDIDPRLGLRSSGGWTPEIRASIPGDCLQRYAQIENALQKLGARMPVALTAPNLPLPPIGTTTGAQRSPFELELSQQAASFLLRASQLAGIRVVPPPCSQGKTSGPEGALDARMELLAGFPYNVHFASALAEAVAAALWQAPPKKGLITDLDDTLWRGIVGEDGTEALSWSQEHHTQTHGLFQQMLGHLASTGVLMAICSKNETTTVKAALGRTDLFVNPESFFPICANWGPKSAGIARILEAWNIGADSVVFVDDNPLEIEEVRQAYPAITGLLFNGKDANSVWRLLGTLRDLFGKPFLTEEDGIRQASVRSAANLHALMRDEPNSSDFLRGVEGAVTFSWDADPSDKRPLQLINKTNQFNLNGMRISEGEWQRIIERPDTLIAVVSYQDKFGPLGKIAVLTGSRNGRSVFVSHWVMSCRAFSRRLEYHTIDALFQYSGVEEVNFAYQATERNQPLQEFFESLGVVPDAQGVHTVSRAQFLERRGDLPHRASSFANSHP